MIPGLINNPPRTTPAPDLPKLGEDAVLPLLIPQPLPGVLGVRGLNRVGPQGLHRKPALVPAEMVSKPKVLETFELVADRAVPDYGSSGSEHDPSSVSLFAMVHDFIENEGISAQQSRPSDTHGHIDTNKASSKVNGAVEMPLAIQSLAVCVDISEETVLRDTQKILELYSDAAHICDNGKPATVMHGCLKRMVISHLQKMGYNAAICKSKWDHVCGIPAGDYEYIDVLINLDVGQPKHPERLLVDIDFQSQFEIARQSDEFTAVWKLLPSVFVGRAERLKQIVQIMSEATKHSLRLKGLHLPPWRKPAYMMAKWFAPYKRTSNISSSRPCKEGDGHGNAVGFAVRGGCLDARYTNTLEMLYHDTASSFLMGEDKEYVSPQKEGDQITVISTDWRPPPVAPRVMALKTRGNITGLSSLMLQGLTTVACKEMIIQAA